MQLKSKTAYNNSINPTGNSGRWLCAKVVAPGGLFLLFGGDKKKNRPPEQTALRSNERSLRLSTFGGASVPVAQRRLLATK
jgi:hypothetical protein